MQIKIFITGGTFDKEYNELDGALYFKNTHLPEVLEQGRSRVPVDIRTLMLIDSLEMREDDRRIIVEHCKKAAEEKILITHGTDTMEETARVLGQAIRDKTIVLIGANGNLREMTIFPFVWFPAFAPATILFLHTVVFRKLYQLKNSQSTHQPADLKRLRNGMFL